MAMSLLSRFLRLVLIFFDEVFLFSIIGIHISGFLPFNDSTPTPHVMTTEEADPLGHRVDEAKYAIVVVKDESN